MKHLAKFLPIVMVFILLLSIVGCKSNNTDNDNYNSNISKVDASDYNESITNDTNDDFIKCPDFTGLSVSEIEDHEYYKDSVMRFTFEYMESEEYDVSHICEQSIEPESKIKKGTVITLYISTGQNEITIPNIYFMDESEAVSLLSGKGFKTKVQRIADNNVDAGKVIKTSPEIGETVTKDQTITIYVSNGATENLISVPDVIGITRPVAISRLESSGFTVKTVMAYNEKYDYGFVFNTNPIPGTNLTEGKLVTIYVSLGKPDETSVDSTENQENIDNTDQ